MLSDALYPDNPLRAHRAAELASDCEHLGNRLLTQMQEFEAALKEADEAYRNTFSASKGVEIPRQQLRISRSVVYEVPGMLAGVAGTIIAERALQQMAIRRLLSQGRIGEAALSRLVGLPSWYKWGKFGGSMVGGLVATLIIQLGIDAVDGAVQRGKLEKAIKDLATPRFRLQRAVVVNQELITAYAGMKVAFTLQKETLDSLPLTDEQKRAALDKVVQRFTEETNKKIEAKSAPGAIKDILSRLDGDRKSWTTADAQPDTGPEPLGVDEALELAYMEGEETIDDAAVAVA